MSQERVSISGRYQQTYSHSSSVMRTKRKESLTAAPGLLTALSCSPREPGNNQPSRMKFGHAPFWVRLYDLPAGGNNRESGLILGSRLGKFIDIDEGTVEVFGKFLRLCVMIDITKQLRRGIMIVMGGRKLWIVIKYERLPNFCYTCGRIGHVEMDCDYEDAKQFHNEEVDLYFKNLKRRRRRMRRRNGNQVMH